MISFLSFDDRISHLDFEVVPPPEIDAYVYARAQLTTIKTMRAVRDLMVLSLTKTAANLSNDAMTKLLHHVMTQVRLRTQICAFSCCR